MAAHRILEGLNEAQRQAVTHHTGPILIVAGAGTGKTTVITRRIAWLIATRRARPDEILALTFTDKAAAEMEERVDTLVPYGYADVEIATFHAFRSEEHTSELQSLTNLVCRLLLEKKKHPPDPTCFYSSRYSEAATSRSLMTI